jgi:hypothetical protein
VRNDASSDLIDFVQRGTARDRDYLYLLVNSARAVLSSGTATTPTAVDCSAFVPPSATFAHLTLINLSSTRTMAVHQDTAGAVLEVLNTGTAERSLLFPVNGSQAIAYANSGASGNANVEVRGFVDEL